MVIFHSYVSLPEGTVIYLYPKLDASHANFMLFPLIEPWDDGRAVLIGLEMIGDRGDQKGHF